jgi:hypothetical protein
LVRGIVRQRRRIGSIALTAVITAAVLTVGAPGAYAGNGFFTNQDLQASIGAPPGQPEGMSGWQMPWDLSRHFAYQTWDYHIVVVSQAAGSSTWSWTPLPDVGVVSRHLATYTYSWDQSTHVIYDSIDHHVHELWTSQNSPGWHDADLTAVTGVPVTVTLSVESGYEQGGNQHVIATAYQFGRWSVWELWFTPSRGWQAANLSQVTHTDLSTTSPQATALGRGDAFDQAIAYTASDQRIHVLTWMPATGWIDVPAGAQAHAPPSAIYTTMTAFQSSGGHRMAVLYGTYGSDGKHLSQHELSWTESTGWADVDVTQTTGTPQLPLQPGHGLFFEADASDHAFVIDDNDAIREFVRTRDDRWVSWKDTADGTADQNTYFTAFCTKDDPQGRSYTEYIAYFDLNRSLHVMDLSAPWTA